jgi:iron complex outermembrane receptor protein
VTDGLALRAAAYTGFRLPTLNELYRGFTVFPITTTANPALQPERLRGAEIGLDVTPADGTQVGITLFDNRLNDAIANVTTGPTTRERRNIGAIVARGVEVTASATLGPVDLTGSYTYSHSTLRAPGTVLDRLDPAQSPRHAGSATLGWRPYDGARLAATLRYSGRQYEDDLNRDAMRDALTLDGFARVPLAHGASLVMRAENIFDATVITRQASGSIDLGTPRTLWIGVEFGMTPGR